MIEVVSWDVVDLLNRLSGTERVERAFDLIDFAFEVVEQGVRDSHPDWDDRQVRREVARRVGGDAA